MGYDDRRHEDRGWHGDRRRDGRDGGDRDRDRDRDCDHGDRDRGRRGGDFEEKRIIDTIVGLVTENVGRAIEDQQARSRHRDGGDGEEKRIVDLIVRLVSEHVREIVCEELDRRLGPVKALPPPGDSDDVESR